MLIVCAIAIAWATFGVLVVALCVAAKRGDAELHQRATFVLVRTSDAAEAPGPREITPSMLR